MVLCEYMKSLGNDVNNLSDNMYVRIKIYLEFYHSILLLANEGRHMHVRIIYLSLDEHILVEYNRYHCV